MTTIEALRSATAALHGHIESRMAIVTRLSTAAGRRDMRRRYAAFHTSADDVFQRHLLTVEGIELDGRRRSHHFRGVNCTQHPLFPEPECTAEALGMFYVVEGSSLGGQIILRRLARQGIDTSGLSYLDPYGSETGRQWQNLVAIVNKEVGVDETKFASAGAVRAFQHAGSILCGAIA